MELGNLIFGNSRGSFPVPDRMPWQDAFCDLHDGLEEDQYRRGIRSYEEFENEMFAYMPYWWDDCTCGFDDLECSERHSDTCYQTRLRSVPYGFKDEAYEAHRAALLTEFDLSRQGCEVHCTCDFYARYEAWLVSVGYPNSHKAKCKLVRPNFLHKPSGFELQWYKYPLRDAYMNQEISLERLREIIRECVFSLEAP